MKTFAGLLRKGDKKHPEKHEVSQSNLMRFRDIRESSSPNGKTAIRDIGKVVQKSL